MCQEQNPARVTPAMIAAGTAALLRLVAEDNLRNDPDWIVAEVGGLFHALAQMFQILHPIDSRQNLRFADCDTERPYFAHFDGRVLECDKSPLKRLRFRQGSFLGSPEYLASLANPRIVNKPIALRAQDIINAICQFFHLPKPVVVWLPDKRDGFNDFKFFSEIDVRAKNLADIPLLDWSEHSEQVIKTRFHSGPQDADVADRSGVFVNFLRNIAANFVVAHLPYAVGASC
jgi:hypothetical protein